MKKNGHLSATRIIAAKIYSMLPKALKSEVNLVDLQQAAMLHDIGKVFIPKEILYKQGALTQREKEIMNLHAEFSYELLKQRGIKESVLRLIKYHHQRPDKTGYPCADEDFEYTLSSQILSAADKYSALTEQRAYHTACTKSEALAIIYEDVDAGVISQEVYDALKKAA
jgi:putative nucleotidyltransferase with HDIG domain